MLIISVVVLPSGENPDFIVIICLAFYFQIGLEDRGRKQFKSTGNCGLVQPLLVVGFTFRRIFCKMMCIAFTSKPSQSNSEHNTQCGFCFRYSVRKPL